MGGRWPPRTFASEWTSLPVWFVGIKLLNEPDINFELIAGTVSYIDECVWWASYIYLVINLFRFVCKIAKTESFLPPLFAK